MPRGRLRTLLPAVLLTAAAAATAGGAGAAPTGAGAWHFSEFRVAPQAMDTLRTGFVDQVLRTHRAGTWAPLKMTLDNRQLRLLGLPSKQFLLSHHFSRPTLVTPDGRTSPV